MSDSLLARAADSVLLIVDIQERLAAAMDKAAMAGVVRSACVLLETASRLGVPVAVTEQYPKGLGATVAEVSAKIPADARRVEKTCFSAGAAEESGRAQVVLVGMEAHVCVLQSALELRASGRQVFVVEDGCCSRDARNAANAMARMRDAGVVVTNTESVAFEWLRDARHEAFKAVSGLVR
jgi:nicotinamidase-related amidase